MGIGGRRIFSLRRPDPVRPKVHLILSMADPAKLELLTRTPGEPGFKVHEVQSSQAYLLFKPARLPETEWELTRQPRSLDGSRNHLLRSPRPGRYRLRGPQGYFLWRRSHGRHSLAEIGTGFHFEFGPVDSRNM